MVKAKLIYRDFNNSSTGEIKFYHLNFMGNEKICKILNELSRADKLIDAERRIDNFKHELLLNKLLIRDNEKRLELIKSNFKKHSLIYSLTEIKKLKKENKYLKLKNDVFKKHMESILKEHDKYFYITKEAYRDMLDEFGFVCKNTDLRGRNVNVEVFESTFSDEELYEKATKKHNEIKSLKDKGIEK